jgi:hypothetical protein
MKIKLIFSQTQYDQNNMWSEIREVEVEIPEWINDKFDNFEWHLSGMIKKD